MITRLFSLVILTLLFSSSLHATHIVGGNFEIIPVGGYNYYIKLKVYRDCSPGTANDVNPDYIYARDPWSHTTISLFSMTNNLVAINTLDLGDDCIPSPPVCVQEYVYQKMVTLFSFSGFYLTWTKCCRNDDILNIQSPLSCSSTFYIRFPPNSYGYNSTPKFGDYPSRGYLCAGEHNYVDDFMLTDNQGDSLVYSLERITDENYYYPFSYCSWTPPASVTNVFGNTVLPNATIDRQTGAINCWPPMTGTYVISVKVKEFRNGVFLGEAVRDVEYRAVTCAPKTPYLSVNFNSYTNDQDLLEGCTAGTVTISRPVSTGDQQVDLQYSGTASPSLDFPPGSLPSSVIIPDGSFSTSFQISAVEDFLTEGTETCQILATTGNIDCAYATSAEEEFFVKPGYSFGVEAQNSGALCSGDSSTFDVTVTTPTQSVYDIIWDQQYTGTPVTFPGNYGDTHVVVVTDSSGCYGTDTIFVDYSGHFFPDPGSDTVICDGASTQLGGTPTGPAGSSYTWTPGSFLTDDTIANPISSPDSSTLYNLTVVAPSGCASSDSVMVNVFQVEMSSLPPSELCPNSQLIATFQSTTPSDSIVWSWGGETSSDTTLIISSTYSEEYCITVYSSNGCISSACDSLLIFPTPDFGIIQDTSTALCSVVQSHFIIYGDTNRITTWEFQGQDIDPGYHPTTFPYNDSGLVQLEVVDTNGCQYEHSQTIWIDPIESFYQQVIPNVFTPNRDGDNESFAIEVTGAFDDCSSFEIYNRWGQRIYSASHLPFSWDGYTLSGDPVSEGTYFYVIIIADHTTTGNITVFR